MDRCVTIDGVGWTSGVPARVAEHAIDALESGAVLRLALPFALNDDENIILRDDVLSGERKNVSFDPRNGRLKGAGDDPTLRGALTTACERYCHQTRALAERLLPAYRDALIVGRTSFRPAEVGGRVPKSWRKDDSRLHVDAFPATPVQGRRMLRFFTNVNPDGQPRHWQVGEPFERMAQRFLPRVPKYSPLTAHALAALHVTKTVRSAYDHYMLHIHDGMKADLEYQRSAAREDVRLGSGETWIVFSDQASHAVLSGRFMFEQTIYVPVDAQRFPERSPLRVLERLTGRTLV
jgi:hypothetical protein